MRDLTDIKERLLTRQTALQRSIHKLLDNNEERVSHGTESSEGEETASSLEEKHIDSYVLDNEVRALNEVQAALRRIEAGTYGICLVCEQPISEARLHALPWAALCLSDQREWERRERIVEYASSSYV
jgi:DnaK suppressor protein